MLIEIMGFEQMFDFPALPVSIGCCLFWLITGWLDIGSSFNMCKKEVKEAGMFYGGLSLVSFIFGTWSVLVILMVTGAYFVGQTITVFWSNWNRE